jgi:hypothetical protein
VPGEGIKKNKSLTEKSMLVYPMGLGLGATEIEGQLSCLIFSGKRAEQLAGRGRVYLRDAGQA